MMDLESAIQHCKEQVQEQAKKGCYSCAEEHQQLAEWLKELKAYKEQSGDAISREELIEALNTWDKFGYAPTNELIPLRGNADKDKYVPYIHYDDVIKCIKGMPSVTPQQRTGRWVIKDGKEQGYDIAGVKTWYIQIMCDKCGFIKTAIEGRIGEYKFCPKCGQPKM